MVEEQTQQVQVQQMPGNPSVDYLAIYYEKNNLTELSDKAKASALEISLGEANIVGLGTGGNAHNLPLYEIIFKEGFIAPGNQRNEFEFNPETGEVYLKGASKPSSYPRYKCPTEPLSRKRKKN